MPAEGLGRGAARGQGARRAGAHRRRVRRRRRGAGAAAARRSGRERRSASSRWRSSGRCAPAAPRRSRSTSRACPGRARRCRTARPSDRAVAAGEVLLFDFGAQVCGYRSDMTRTLFVGEPRRARPPLYRLVGAAQEAAFDARWRRPRPGATHPSNRAVDAAARDVIDGGGQGDQFGHGLGHGIGLATHEGPSLGPLAPSGRCRHPRCSASSRASTSTARPASASRTSSSSTRAAGAASG